MTNPQFDGHATNVNMNNIEIYECRGPSTVSNDDLFFRGTLQECENFKDKRNLNLNLTIYCCTYRLVDKYEI